MNCNEIRELISCMLDGELSADDSAIVAEHLAECPECMRVFEAFHTISLSLEEMEEVPVGFTEDVMSRIKQSGTKTTKPKRVPIFRMAGLAAAAACAALVIMTGTSFTTNMRGGNSDSAEYSTIRQATPAPASADGVMGYVADTQETEEGADNHDALHTSIGEAVSTAEADNKRVDPVYATPTVVAVELSPAVDVEHTEQAEVTMAPPIIPAVSPTPIPQMELLFQEDLLLAAEEAAFDLFADHPAYEITLINEDGKEITLKIWIDGKRIYCKDEAAGTAWYTFGTPEQLMDLLGEPAMMPTATDGGPVLTGEYTAKNT